MTASDASGHKGKVIKVEKTIKENGQTAEETIREDGPEREVGAGTAQEGAGRTEAEGRCKKTADAQGHGQADLGAADGIRGDGQAGREAADGTQGDSREAADGTWGDGREAADGAAAGQGAENAGDDAAAEATSDEGAATGDGKEKEKKGFFHKKEKKDPKDEKIEDLTDRLRRSMAEFDNYRKRTDKEKAAMYEIGAKDIIEKILPVLDNLERGIAAVPEDAKGSSLAEGMEMIYKQFLKTLEDMGVTPIEAMGKPFDPNFHNAVMHVDDESLGENVVSAELQKGYLYRDSVVRHSMVQVAN